jgi:hypothetical protein
MFALLAKIGIIKNMGRETGFRPENQKEKIMSAYTSNMVAELTKNAPLNLGKAKAFAEKYPAVTYRSVIAKAKSLGLEYEKAAPVARKAKSDEPTKAATLGAIRKALALPEREGDLTKAELVSVLESLG